MVHSKFNGSIMDFLDAVTVSCEDFVMMCKMGLRSEMPGDQCCREVFSKKVSFKIDSNFSTQSGPHTNFLVAFVVFIMFYENIKVR